MLRSLTAVDARAPGKAPLQASIAPREDVVPTPTKTKPVLFDDADGVAIDWSNRIVKSQLIRSKPIASQIWLRNNTIKA